MAARSHGGIKGECVGLTCAGLAADLCPAAAVKKRR
jgi:hypothetical protein